MNEERDRDIEELLKNSLPLSIPPGLRGRVLSGMAKRRSERVVLTPRLRVCFIVSAVVLFSTFAADAFLTRRDAVRIAALFPSVAPLASLADDPILRTDILAAIPNRERLLKERVHQDDAEPKFQPFQRGNDREFIKEGYDVFEN